MNHKSFIALTFVIALIAGANFINAAWSTPTATPPNNNVEEPINTSINPQTKNGILTLSALGLVSTAPTLGFFDSSANNWWTQVNDSVTPGTSRFYLMTDRNKDGMWSDETSNPLEIIAGATSVNDVAKFSNQVQATSFLYSSDARLKNDIKTVAGLAVVKKLRGVSFDWKNSGQRDYGLIAQEVEQVLPELVKTDSEGYKSVEYGHIIGILVEAIKEQQQEIDALRAQIE